MTGRIVLLLKDLPAPKICKASKTEDLPEPFGPEKILTSPKSSKLLSLMFLKLEMGFNVNYLIEVLGALSSNEFRITLSDSASSALVEDADELNNAQYVVMPMRL